LRSGGGGLLPVSIVVLVVVVLFVEWLTPVLTGAERRLLSCWHKCVGLRGCSWSSAAVVLSGLASLGLLGCGGTNYATPAPGPDSTPAVVDDGAPPSNSETLPLRDRDWESAAELDVQARDATTAPDADDQDSNPSNEAPRTAGRLPTPASGLSVAGLSKTENSETLDGLSAWQAFGAGPRGTTAGGVHAGASFAEGAVQSFRLSPRLFSAESGGAGGTMAAETRGGEARWHASLGGLLRESAWAATNPFSVVTRYDAAAAAEAYSSAAVTESLAKPRDTLGQVEGNAGGPLPPRVLPARLRGRVQGFASLEEQLQSNPVVSSPANPAFFTLSAEQLALLGTRGVDGVQISTALGYLDSLMGTVARSSARTLAFIRADVQPDDHDRLTLAWVGNRFRSAAGAAFGGVSEAVIPSGIASVGDQTVRIDAGTGAWAHVWRRGWANDVRVQVARDLEYEQPRAPLPQEPAIGPGGSAPEVAIGPNGFSYGTPANLGKTAYPDEQRVEVAEHLEWLHGRNEVRLGGDWSRLDDTIASVTNADGTFSYDSGVTDGKDGGLVDWITDDVFGVNAYPNAGCPSVSPMTGPHYFCFRSFTQSFGPQRMEFVTHELAAYAEDAWRTRHGFSVAAGVRWEYTLLPLPQTPNPALDAGLLSVLAAKDARAGTTNAFPEDRNNFGPRLGAAWANRWLTVTLGYGGFFGRVPGATIRAALANTLMATSVTRVRIVPSTETVCPQVPSVGFGYPCDFVSAPPAAVVQTGRATVFARDFRVPSVQRFSLELKRDLGKHAEATLGYAGAIATQLPGSVDLNLAPATGAAHFVLQGGDAWKGLQTGQAFALPLYTTRLLPQYGPISAVTSTANATYHSAEAQVRAHWGRLEVRGAYAFSRAIDYAPQLSAEPGVMTQLDPFVDGYDKGRSSLDFTHRFVGSLTTQTSWTRGPVWERRLFSQWKLSAIGTAGSGAPYSYAIFGGSYLNGGSESINGAGGAAYLPTVGRNTLRLPVRGKLDVRVGREITLRGRWRIDGFAEAFNALNERSLTRVETRAFLPGTPVNGVTPLIFQDAGTIAAEGVSTPPFGTPVSSTSALSRERQVEFGVRASF
jgi:hypothetical protein